MALTPKKVSEFTDLPSAAVATDVTLVSRGGASYKMSLSMLRSFVAGELGDVLVTDGERDSVQTALDQAKVQAALSTTPITVHITRSPVTNGMWDRGVNCLGAVGARINRVNLWFADGVKIMKNAATWNTDNALFNFAHQNGCRIYGNAILDGGQPSVPLGTIQNLNGLAGDGIRFFSVTDIVLQDLRFQNFGDSFVRASASSLDATPTNSTRMLLERIVVVKAGQFSTTNSSGEVPGVQWITARDCYFEQMNSFKVAVRGVTRGVRIESCYFKGCVTDIEIDGPSNVYIHKTFHDSPTTRAINLISNNSFVTAPNDFPFFHVEIDSYGLNCPNGVLVKPDTQSSEFEFICHNVDIKFKHEGTLSNAGFGIDLDGAFMNLKAHLISHDWSAGSPFRYNARGQGQAANVHLIAEGSFSNVKSAERIFFQIDADANGRGPSDIDSLTLEYCNVNAAQMSRGIILQPTTRTLGTAAGATLNTTAYNVDTTTLTLAAAGTGTIVAGDAIKFTGGSIGTAASTARTNTAGYAIGATTITLNAAGSGTIIAGDFVRFGASNDPNWYRVVTGNADVSAGGTVVIAAPGLLVAIPASQQTIDVAPLDNNVYTVKTGDADVSGGGTIVLDTPLKHPVHASRAIAIQPRYFIRELKVRGSLKGSFTNGAFLYNGSQMSHTIDIQGHRYIGDKSTGYSIARFVTGIVDGCLIDSASTPLSIASTCSSVRIGKNDLFTAGVPTVPTNSQGFKMASAARTTTQVDVDITAGLGTDLTVPSNSARCFTFTKPDGVTPIKITAVAKVDADTIRFTLETNPRTSTASGATTDNAGYAVGATVLTLASAGTGAIVKGDYVCFAGDVTPYLVVSGDADVSDGGSITIAEPGLRKALSAATKAITFPTSTLKCFDEVIQNDLNGGQSDPALLPYDNTTGCAAKLQRGFLAVA